MTTDTTLFGIEGFFRTRSSYKQVLRLDEIILRDDIDDDKKMALVNELIEETLKTVQGSGK